MYKIAKNKQLFLLNIPKKKTQAEAKVTRLTLLYVKVPTSINYNVKENCMSFV